nr:MAG TPA: hypothetical protein [Caudoviricetes sp.]
MQKKAASLHLFVILFDIFRFNQLQRTCFVQNVTSLKWCVEGKCRLLYRLDYTKELMLFLLSESRRGPHNCLRR